MIYDFHTHTFLSDGVLSPIELIRRAYVRGYGVIAVTDHVGLEEQERVIKTLVGECRRASEEWDILAIPGVEITHVPKNLIAEAAQRAKDLGAQIVVVHGETIVEPVEPGSNLAALKSPCVDILAHPGIITEEEAALAAENEVFLEISSRRGHSLTNGHVAKVGLPQRGQACAGLRRPRAGRSAHFRTGGQGSEGRRPVWRGCLGRAGEQPSSPASALRSVRTDRSSLRRRTPLHSKLDWGLLD